MQNELLQALKPVAVTTICAGGGSLIVSENEDYEKIFFETELYLALFGFPGNNGVPGGAHSRILFRRLPRLVSDPPLTG